VTLSEALSRIKAIGLPVIRSADVAAALDVGRSHATIMLARLSRHGHLVRIKRGLWVQPGAIDSLALVPYLTAPFPAYVSAHSALYYHGMISQVPERVYCVSPARTHTYVTPLGTFSVHHISSAFFLDYDAVGEGPVFMATPEKALVDFLYLRPARSRLFSALPELNLPARFRISHGRRLISRIPGRTRRQMVRKTFESLVQAQTTLRRRTGRRASV
jgi:predicted transcriptional regulator of viral defense system